MSMKINGNSSDLGINAKERLKEKQALDRTEEAKETDKASDKTSVPKDEYISSEKSGEKPSGLYRLGQDENGNKKLIYDAPDKAGNAKEKCIANTDQVDREIEKLKEKKKELEQQIRAAFGDEEKIKELEKKLADIENELSQKDNDTYRRQNASVTIQSLASSCSETAGRIQEVNQVVTNAVHNLSKHSQDMADYLSDTILKEFQEFVCSGRQYKEDADYVRDMIDAFNNRTDRLKNSMNEIADSIESITKAIDDGASGITGVADSTKSLVENMADITGRMDTNREIVEELKKQMEVFADF